MITDAQLRLSSAQSLAAVAGTYVSTNTIDLLSANRNIGRGQELRCIAQVLAAMTGGTSVQVQIIQSANANLSAPDVLLSGPVVLTAALVAGKTLLDVPMPDNTKQYIGVQYVTVGTFAAGTVNAHLVSDTDANNYPPMNTGF